MICKKINQHSRTQNSPRIRFEHFDWFYGTMILVRLWPISFLLTGLCNVTIEQLFDDLRMFDLRSTTTLQLLIATVHWLLLGRY